MTPPPHIRTYDELEQGSEEWAQARCGLLTASEMKLIITPTLKVASNEKERSHLYELLAQRVTHYVEPQYVSDDMLRGRDDEFAARDLYAKHYASVSEVGFITNNRWGFTIGYSPDGLVGDEGLIESKSRRQKYQVQTVIENAADGTIPDDYIMQCQTALLVSERKWLDFISYSGGLPMFITRVYPDKDIQYAIVEAAGAFEARLNAKLATYNQAATRFIPTERSVAMEIF